MFPGRDARIIHPGIRHESPAADWKLRQSMTSGVASVEIPYGTVDGCFLYSVDAWEEMGEEGPMGPMHVDVYVKPDFGIVRISMVPDDAMELVSVTFP